MLRINPTYHAAQAKSYYSQSDYYTQDQELPGVWGGKGAELLGLRGEVGQAEFEALCDNRHPATGEPLTARTNGKRVVGYDFNFHAPKSLSLLYATTEDRSLLEAFQDSVDETMRLIEAEMKTRVRKEGAMGERTTGNLVWGRFDHLTSRPVDGEPDMHLHSHSFVLNATHDDAELRWKAGFFRDLKRDAPFFQAVFHSKLTAKLRDLGLPLEQTPEGWEVSGFARATLDKFSRRTKQIEELAESRGITDAKEKAELGAKTREGKAKNLTMSELRRLWWQRLDETERQRIRKLADRQVIAPSIGLDARPALDYACWHLFERHSVVAERQLLGEMLRSGLGRFSLHEAQATLQESPVIVREVKGRRLATTQEVISEEERLIAFAREGRGREAPLRPNHTLQRDWLNAGQRAAVRHVLTSPDRVMLIRGFAGVGKTTLMQEAVAGIEAQGKQVFAFAPSAEASRGVLRSEGFEAETVARLLVDPQLQEKTCGQVLWIDEAGLLSTKAMLGIFEIAERNDCRVILSGDPKQHGSVELGSVLKILENQAGLKAAEVKEIKRQKGEYRAAVESLAAGRTEEGFDRLDQLGWVHEITEDERYRRLADDYVAAVQRGRTALVVSPTHAEGALVNVTIRQKLREKGRLGAEEREVPSLARVDLTEAQKGRTENYREGDILQFHQNARWFRTGERLTVGEKGALPLDRAKHFQVYRPGKLSLSAGDRVRITNGGKTRDGHRLENGSLFTVAGFTERGDIQLQNGWVVDRDFGHLTHGYVTTSHASQGKTVDHVFIAQSSQSWPASSREQFLVSASRARQQVTVYTDDKTALREAIGRSDERMAATELVTEADRLREQARLRLRREAQRQQGSRSEPPRAAREAREAARE
jgi:conjugative relaxase-like TrwC/TraI family protein